MPLLNGRWNPKRFNVLLEAARWASSCFNEQPWVFILATVDQPAGHSKLLNCLVDGNQVWAKRAPLLMITVAKQHFDHNGQPNRHAFHDVGLAVGNLVVQATVMDLVCSSNGGDSSRYHPRIVFPCPPGMNLSQGLAIGYPGDLKYPSS